MKSLYALGFALLSSVTARASSVDEPKWVPEMALCGAQVSQYICTVRDGKNQISSCRPEQVKASEDAWIRFSEDFGIDETVQMTCKILW